MLRISAETRQSKLRTQIEELLHNTAVGERLPSEPNLAKQFGVSRTMIRDIMGQLESEGFVIRRQGKGTFVSRPPLSPEENLRYFMDFPTLIAKKGYTPALHQLGFVTKPAGKILGDHFNMNPEDKVITRRQIYTANGNFCVLAEESFPATLLSKGQLTSLLRAEEPDFRLFLFNATGRTPYQDETAISVISSSEYPFLQTVLNGKEKTLLCFNCLCLDQQNQPFICSQIYSDTDYIQYRLNRRIL